MNIKILVVALLALALSAPTSAAKVQCWTDENGNRMCGDRVPPEYAGEKREVMEEGRVVETLRAAKTAEEIAAEKRAVEEAEEERKRMEYDRALLESYRDVSDIQNMRDERLAMLDMRIRAAEKSVVESTKTLESLRDRVAKEEKEGPKKRLEEQIVEYEKTVEEHQMAAERIGKQREEMRLKYESDLQRYDELRPGTARNPDPEKKAEPAEKTEPAGEKKAGS